MWRTSSLTCRAVFLAVLCGSAASARAGIIVFQPIEAPKFIGPATKPLLLDATKTAGYVSFTFTNDVAPELIVAHPPMSPRTHVDLDNRAAFLRSLAAMLRGPGASLTPLAVAPDPWGGHDPLPTLHADFPAGATLGRSAAFACAVNPAEYLQMGFSPGSSFDGLLPSLHTGMGDPIAGVYTVSDQVQGPPLVGAAGGQTSDEFVRRAPVPGALLLAVFGLGVAGLSWRRFM